MKKFVTASALAITALTLSACGKSDRAGDKAEPENVELPAEEAMQQVDPAATPVPDEAAAISPGSAAPSDAVPEVSVTQEAAAVVAPAAASPAASASAPAKPATGTPVKH